MKRIKNLAYAGAMASVVFVSGNGYAQTEDLRGAMESLTKPFAGATSTTNAPQRFRSEVRSGLSLGSGRVTFPANQRYAPRQILTLQAPDYNVGCSGIDYHLGGASWVSLDAIRQMVEAAIPAAALFIAEMLLSAISGDMLSSMRSVMRKIMDATQLATNSCEVGQLLAADILDRSGDLRRKNCDSVTSEAGMAQDRVAARAAVCETDRTLTQVFNDWLGDESAPDPERKAAASKSEQDMCELMNNKTWCGLRAANVVLLPLNQNEADGVMQPYEHTFASQEINMRSYALGEIMQSIMGAEVPVPADKTEGNDQASTKTMTSVLKGGEDFMMLILCGTDFMEDGVLTDEGTDLVDGLTTADIGAESMAAILDYVATACMRVASASFSRPLPPAETPDGAEAPRNRNDIREIYYKNRDETGISKILACLPEDTTSGTEGEAVNTTYLEGNNFEHFFRCNNPQPIPLNVWASSAHAKTLLGGGVLFDTLTMLGAAVNSVRMGLPIPDRTLALMERSPFPLYRLVNIAAIYPGGESYFYEGTGFYISTILAYELMEQMMRQIYRQGTNTNAYSGQMAKVSVQAMLEASQSASQFVDRVAIGETRALEFTQRIETLERSVLRSIYQRNLLGNYAASVEMVQAGGGP